MIKKAAVWYDAKSQKAGAAKAQRLLGRQHTEALHLLPSPFGRHNTNNN